VATRLILSATGMVAVLSFRNERTVMMMVITGMLANLHSR
jgi:hypothetical protein